MATITSIDINNEAEGVIVYALGSDNKLYRGVVGKGPHGEYKVGDEIAVQWIPLQSVVG